jgi:DNA-binding transcriptional regulator GbsR (MarR family)
MVLNEKTQAFVEKMGLMFERMGSTRTAGRLMGLLLVADEPMSLTDMAETLNVSKASMSTNARMAEQIEMARRVSLPGDRRDYYEITPRFFERMVDRRIQMIDAFINLTDEGLAAVGDDNASARVRMEKMKEFYSFFLAELEALLGRWRDRERGESE